MPELLVINDMPDEVTLAGTKRTSRIQIAKTGSFSDPRYGKFTITTKDFSKWISNFQTLNKSDGRLGLPVDVDHRPETQGDTQAAGWITSLDIDANGTVLWATVEWNDLGIELVKSRRYAYISPSYVANYKDETGKEHGTALLGVALTNRPFLSMATVSLSRLHQTESYTPDEMAIPKTLATALGIAEDADEATILARVTELTKEPEPQNKSLADLAKAEGMHVLTAAQYASMAQNASEGAAAAATLKEQKFELAFSSALNDSKGARVTPAQKEQFKLLYDGNADATVKLLETLPNIVNAEPIGSGGGGDDTSISLSAGEVEDFSTDEYTNKLAEKAAQLCAADAKLDYGDAVLMASKQIGR